MGCSPTRPYRTDLPDQPLNCPQTGEEVPESCRTSMWEHTDGYDLSFVEFDDQGLLYPKGKEGVGDAWQQLDRLMTQLRELARANRGISLFVYVHGWKHNADTGDDDVSGFREALDAASQVEKATQVPHRVVGIYVSWRGLSVTVEPLKELSFWDRKFTAEHVAEGSVRELFSRLKGFQRFQNEPTRGDTVKQLKPGDRAKVRIIMVGHSFGGLLLFNAISESLIGSLTYDIDSDDGPGQAQRFGDMVVLLNPAFEATRYAPLHRIATSRKYSRYQAPIFVSVTTTADWATGYAFPFGRFFNTIFETTASEEEKLANNNTIGHIAPYITHKLSLSKQEPSACAGWKNVESVRPEERPKQMKVNLAAETANNTAFFGSRTTLLESWERTFCGGAMLKHIQYNANSPIWNIQTDKDIMTGHNDIKGAVLTNFLRQLYRDSVTFPLMFQ
jgi:hypothetical protein